MTGSTYELEGFIAYGGVAEVYLATEHLETGVSRPVVVKRLQPQYREEPSLVKDFLAEAGTGLLLRHPHIVKTLGWIEDDEGPGLLLEHVDGPPLSRVVENRRRAGQLMTPAAAATLIASAASGLAHAHDIIGPDELPLRLIHRDIKPSNLMLTSSGVLRVMDFGIALSSERTRQTIYGTLKGTPRYMSPEQACCILELTPASDIFSLGAVFYELLTLKVLFEADDTYHLLTLIRDADVRLQLEQLPREALPLLPVLERMLAKDPADRYPDAGMLVQAIEAVLPELPGALDASGELAQIAQLIGPAPLRAVRFEDRSPVGSGGIQLRRAVMQLARSGGEEAPEDDQDLEHLELDLLADSDTPDSGREPPGGEPPVGRPALDARPGRQAIESRPNSRASSGRLKPASNATPPHSPQVRDGKASTSTASSVSQGLQRRVRSLSPMRLATSLLLSASLLTGLGLLRSCEAGSVSIASARFPVDAGLEPFTALTGASPSASTPAPNRMVAVGAADARGLATASAATRTLVDAGALELSGGMSPSRSPRTAGRGNTRADVGTAGRTGNLPGSQLRHTQSPARGALASIPSVPRTDQPAHQRRDDMAIASPTLVTRKDLQLGDNSSERPTHESTVPVALPTDSPAPPIQDAGPNQSAPGYGIVSVGSLPFAEVWLDYRHTDGPVRAIRLPAGAHRVRLHTADGQNASFTIQVESGKTLTYRWLFDRNQLQVLDNGP